jgi:hypothetical protein
MKYPRLIIFLLLLLQVPLLCVGVSEVVQVDADLPGVALFMDGVYIGDTPYTLTDLAPGDYTLAATLIGHSPILKTFTVTPQGSDPIFFTFGHPQNEKAVGMIRIHDCVGTPEQTGLRGTSITVATLPDDSLMAYYTGFGDGIQCAGSQDGKRWYEYPDGCLQGLDSVKKTVSPFSRPWVFDVSEGGLRMIYLANDGDGLSLFRAFSDDGYRFVPEGKVKITHLSESDVLSPEQYSIPTGLRLEDGTLRMYYSAPGGGIKSAVSYDDGESWTDDDGYRIMSATDPSVLFLPDGTYCLFYVDLSAGSKGQRLMAGISSDGLLFSFSEEGMILRTEEKGVWILDPEIHVSKDGKWNLYYSVMGIPGETGIELPAIMRSVIDSGCLIARLS